MLDPTQTNSLEFYYLLKKIIWVQFSKVLLTFFNLGLGKDFMSSVFDTFFNINDGKINKNGIF